MPKLISVSGCSRFRIIRPGVLALAIATGFGALPLGPLPAHAQSQLPALGDTVSEDFNPSAERHLGERIMVEVHRDPAYLDEPILQDYLQTIWQPLLAAARARGEISSEIEDRFAWESFLMRDRTVNAFALPGGYVGVHLGLIAITNTRDELASVLAHEMSHVTQRHIARSIAQSKRQSLLALASMILGAIAVSRSPEAAQAIVTGGQAAAIQGQLNFSRDMEREADRIGFGVLQQGGFAGSGMASMFERLQQASRLNDSNAFPYLRTHPLTSERIGEARQRLGTQGSAPPKPVLEHTMMQARSRVLMDTRPDSLRQWMRPSEAPEDRSAQLLTASHPGTGRRGPARLGRRRCGVRARRAPGGRRPARQARTRAHARRGKSIPR